MPPLPGTGRGEHPVTDDDEVTPNVKPARTTSGGAGPKALRRLDGGVGEAKLPPLRAKEEEAPRAATFRWRGLGTDDDAATIGGACSAAQREPARWLG